MADVSKINVNSTEYNIKDTTARSGLNDKQNIISDLETIRSGSALGATAVQPETGKGLSTNDYTDEEKTKLAGIADGAEVGTVTSVAIANASGLAVTGSPITSSGTIYIGHSHSISSDDRLTIKKFTYDYNGHIASSSELSSAESNVLASGIDAVKVTQIETNKNDISALETALNGKVDEVSGKGLSTNDYTTGEKEKLAGIEAQANKTVVDDALSDLSTNPVQNKIVKSALDSKQNTLATAQLAAVNSGITSTDVEQITENENNILSLTANAAITSIISDVTMATGFTLEAQSFLYKQGKHIFGRLIISSTNAYTTSDVKPCTIGAYKPSPHYVAFCGLGADMWKIKSIGYAYISSLSGDFKVNDSGNNSNYTVNIPIDYVTA